MALRSPAQVRPTVGVCVSFVVGVETFGPLLVEVGVSPLAVAVKLAGSSLASPVVFQAMLGSIRPGAAASLASSRRPTRAGMAMAASRPMMVTG